MLITVDGFKGAGKTTQMELIKEQMPVTLLQSGGRAKEVIVDLMAIIQPDIKYLTRLAVRDLWEINQRLQDTNKDDIILMDWFFVFFMYYERKPSLLKKWLECLAIKPSLSFFLHIPYSQSIERLLERGDLKIYDRGESYSKEMDRLIDNMIEWLSAELPYFYVIDGTQSIDDVEMDIKQILDKELEL